jgi:hypothetical protein
MSLLVNPISQPSLDICNSWSPIISKEVTNEQQSSFNVSWDRFTFVFHIVDLLICVYVVCLLLACILSTYHHTLLGLLSSWSLLGLILTPFHRICYFNFLHFLFSFHGPWPEYKHGHKYFVISVRVFSSCYLPRVCILLPLVYMPWSVLQFLFGDME